MHYGGDFYQKDNHVYTMFDKTTRRPVQQNLDLSQQDFELLNIIYPAIEVDEKDSPDGEQQVYPSGELKNDRPHSVLMLNSDYKSVDWKLFGKSEFEWRPAVVISPNGTKEELNCFKHDSNTEARGSCSINWKNQMIIFGGMHETKQISRLDGFSLFRIGNLDFDHYYGACSVMKKDFIFLCFDSWSLRG